VIDYGLDYHWNISGVSRRNGTILFHKKMGVTTKEASYPDSVLREYEKIEGYILPLSLGKRERIELFSKAEIFVSFDASSFISLEAAIAGCKSIVVPVPGFSKEEWLKASYGEDVFGLGIAYGMNDTDYVETTRGMILQRVTEQEEEETKQLSRALDELVRF